MTDTKRSVHGIGRRATRWWAARRRTRAASRDRGSDGKQPARSPYRDPRAPLAQRLREVRRSERATTSRFVAAEAVRVRRLARQSAAAVAMIALPLVVAAGLTRGPAVVNAALSLAVAATLFAWMVTGLVCSAAARARLRARLATTSDPLADLARIEDRAGLAALLEANRRLELPSLALPLVASAFYVPLALHLPAALLLGTTPGTVAGPLGALSQTVLGSYLKLGHAHALLALLSVVYVRQLVRGEVAPGHAVAHGWRALVWTALVTAIPGTSLAGGGSVMVGLIGLAVVPALFALASDTLHAERTAMSLPASASAPLASSPAVASATPGPTS